MAESKIAKLTAAAKAASDADELREKLAQAESRTAALQAIVDKQKSVSGSVPSITFSDAGPWPCVECQQPLAKATTTYCNQCGAKQPKKEPVALAGGGAGGSSADAALAAQLKAQLEKTELALEASRQEVAELREEINRLESELDAAAELLGGNLDEELIEEAQE